MTITVRIDRVYGKLVIYPVCPAAMTFAQLAGTKTLTKEALNLIKRLGIEISIQGICGINADTSVVA